MSTDTGPGGEVQPAGATAVVTVLILPGGAVHLPGGLIAIGGSAEHAARTVWQLAQEAAQQLGHPLMVKVALPDGSVDAALVIAGVQPVPSAPAWHQPRPDVRWDHPVPDRSGLLQTIGAAQRAGQFAGAEVAAGRLASALSEDLGVHPYAVLALELQARCAVAAQRWDRASTAHLTAAAARHSLGDPSATEGADTSEAVNAWLRTAANPAASPAGLELAHTLLGLCPTRPELLAALLRQAAVHLPARTHDLRDITCNRSTDR